MRNKTSIIVAVFLLISTSAYAQPAFEEVVDDTAPIPGIFIAIAAAIGLGIMNQLRTKKNNRLHH